MELHFSLYKERTNILSSKQLHRHNRQLQEANRNKQRKDRFQDSRNISPNPTPHKAEITLQICRDDQENIEDATNRENLNSTKSVKLVSTTDNPVKLSRQEQYLKRFLEWKENKKKEELKKQSQNKKKPFVPVVNCTKSSTTTAASSLVPKGHHKEFRPPAGVKPVDMAKIKGRQSIYTVVPTPPRKKQQSEQKVTKKFSSARKALPPTNLHNQIVLKSANKQKMTTATTITIKPAAVESNILDGPSTSKAAPKLMLAANGAKSTTKVSAKKTSDWRNQEKPSTTNKTKPATNLAAKAFDTTAVQPVPITRSKLKPRTLQMPPPPMPTIKRTAVQKPTSLTNKPRAIPALAPPVAKKQGAAGKISSLPKTKNKSPLKSGGGGGARLAQTLKAKKGPNTSKRVNTVNPTIKLNGRQLLNIVNDNNIIQTPKDFANINPFEEFVTSTKIKDISSDVLEGVSPAKTSIRSHGNSSAKRNILNDSQRLSNEESNKQPAENNNNLDDCIKVASKFNFIRYSEANVSFENQEKDQEKEKNSNAAEEKQAQIQKSPNADEITPTKYGPKERPCNYLSPFVSVARGKVSLRAEKEKRNSLYLQTPPADNVDAVSENSPTCSSNSPKYSVEVRRILEAVRYFRQQLQDEIVRLHRQCELWESYKEENLEKIQNANGEDMINVTIGQTRLLTSKKFMQFKGLIDRCESGATGINAVPYDGSEDTKPITDVDLEGFWSMLGIQIDNLDKRFENLGRWKLNDWQDPDEQKPKTKKNLTKVRKAKAATATAANKAKPSSAFQQMLRTMRKNRNNKNEEANVDVLVVTPSKMKHSRRSGNKSTPRKSLETNNSPRRLSMKVKDRKYFSPAATVISITSPAQRRPSQESPKLLKHVQEFQAALNDLQSSGDLRKSALINNGSMTTRRMSLNPQSPFALKNNRKTSLDSPKTLKNSNTTEANENGGANGATTSPKSPPRFSSPAPSTSRKSILKTPGTANSRLRNVIFNEKLRVKKFNFMLTEDSDPWNEKDNDDTHEEDLAKSHEDEPLNEGTPQRTLSLRNRKVKLRPSCEIVIPTAASRR